MRAKRVGVRCFSEGQKAHIGAGIGRLSTMTMERGAGSWVWNTEGRKYLDFACGIGVTNLGHCHPKVTAAVHAQVDKIWHAQVNISHNKPMLDMVERLRPLVPKGLEQFLFVTTGAEAVEAAVKLARHATKKPNVVVFQGGYHGRTLLAGAMTTSKAIFRAGYGPAPSGIFVAPFPYEHRGGSTAESMRQLELLLRTQTTPDETCAVVVEPVQGEGGYVPPPADFMPQLRAFCDRHDLLLVADEVQTGFGRTGKMFAVEHTDTKPDILVFAKGIASGMPIAGLAAKPELCAAQPAGSQGGTYAGNAVACAAACATLDVLTQEPILANANARGQQIMQGLRKLEDKRISDIRGVGLMVGVEFDAAAGTASKLSQACLDRGMLLLATGCYETVRLVPPLNVSEDECAEGLRIFADALASVE